MKRTLSVILGLMIVAAVCAWADDGVPDNVVSLFQKRCAVCHKGKTPPQGLSFEPARIAAVIGAPSKERPDLKIIDPADPGSSYLLKKIQGAAGIKGSRMPPPRALDPEEIKVLETWILGLKTVPAPI